MANYINRRLRLPIPGYKDPYTGAGTGLRYPYDEEQVSPSVVNGMARQQGMGGPSPNGPRIPSQTQYPGTIPETPSSMQQRVKSYADAGQQASQWAKELAGRSKPDVKDIGISEYTGQRLSGSPFLKQIYQSIRNIDPEQRSEYLQTTAASIKDRLDRYEFRIARGIPLTPEQQRQYDSIRGAYNDIQMYINNPKPYDAYYGNL